MVKSKDGIKREAYSIKVNMELINKLRHLAIDKNKTIGQLVEEAITLYLAKKK